MRTNLKTFLLTSALVVGIISILLPPGSLAQQAGQDEHSGQNAVPSAGPAATPNPSQAPTQGQTKGAGEQPRQLAAPNGPLQTDPNQNLPGKEVPGAAGVPIVPGKAEDQAPPAAAPANWVTALRLYEGAWVVKADRSDRSQIFTDTCQVSGTRFYECEHVIDGETIALLVFVPGDEPGHYYTQSVLPSGTALGRGDLAITGDIWVFNTRTVKESGAVEHERVTRVYSGRDKDTIHYVVERSDDGLHWATSNTGTEKRRK